MVKLLINLITSVIWSAHPNMIAIYLKVVHLLDAKVLRTSNSKGA